MIHAVCPITSLENVGSLIYVLGFRSSNLSANIAPGQFVNIKVDDSGSPLLRRPFSVYRVIRDVVQIIFNVVGTGTKILSEKRPGEMLDVIGPLGRPFGVKSRYETALLVAGGIGVAPLPLITDAIGGKRNIVTFLGARTENQVVRASLRNVLVATDDGSEGFHGTVVDLLRHELSGNRFPGPRIFACGPNAMLKSLNNLAAEYAIPCEVSLESAMACGIGICQGCPVERVGQEKKYSLVCKEGPVFDSQTIRFS
jgi:dihydroorotate dehydrogenase electron transfer subunit